MGNGNEVTFDAIKQNGYKNVLTYRGENKKSGVSYDYMDKLNEFIDKTIFIDKDGDGFTLNEKQALKDEFVKIHTERGYSTNFTSMLPGTATEYSYEEFLRLAQAAGYVLKEQPKKEAVVKEVKTETPEEVVQPAEVENPAPGAEQKEAGQDVEVDFDIVTVTDENGEVISRTTKSEVKQFLTAGNTRKKTAAAPDALPSPVKPEGTLTAASSAPVSASTNQTAEGKIVAGLDSDSELAGKSPEERLQILKQRERDIYYQKQELSRTTETYKTKGFLGMFKKTKTRELTAEEIAARQQEIAKLNAQLDTTEKHKAYVEQVETSYWNGPVSPADLMDEDGNVVTPHTTYHRDTVTDESGQKRKVARIDSLGQPDEYGYKPMVGKYYSLDVQKVGDPRTGQGTYYQVVPDMTNELKDVK